MRVWVTRDKGDRDAVDIWRSEPDYFGEGNNSCSCFYYDVVSAMLTLGSRDFKSSFGFTPRKGSVGQYELSLKEIK